VGKNRSKNDCTSFCTTTEVRGINITIHTPFTHTPMAMRTTPFAARTCIGHAVSHPILVLVLLVGMVWAKIDLKMTVPAFCTTTEVRGINIRIHTPFTHTPMAMRTTHFAARTCIGHAVSHPILVLLLKNGHKIYCTSFMHHNRGINITIHMPFTHTPMAMRTKCFFSHVMLAVFPTFSH
jgi:hypothetical protein